MSGPGCGEAALAARRLCRAGSAGGTLRPNHVDLGGFRGPRAGLLGHAHRIGQAVVVAGVHLGLGLT
jgi:hypothetical protein